MESTEPSQQPTEPGAGEQPGASAPSSWPAPPMATQGSWTPQDGQGVWPPPQSGQDGVWPPPPSGQGHDPYASQYYEFLFLYKRDSTNISDFRKGTISVDPEGLTLQGKAAIPAEIYKPIVIVAFLFTYCWALIPDLIMRYAIFQDRICRLRWGDIQRIVVVEERCVACIVYDAPNAYGKVKTFSFAFSLPPERFESFLASVNQFAPGLVRPGKPRGGESAFMIGVMILMILWFILVMVIVASSRHT